MRLRRPVCPHKLRWHSVQALEEISAEVTRKRDSAHPLSKIAESRSSHPQLKVMVVPCALRTVWPSRSRCHVSRNKIGMTPRCHISHLSPAKASIIYHQCAISPRPPGRTCWPQRQNMYSTLAPPLYFLFITSPFCESVKHWLHTRSWGPTTWTRA